MAMATQATAILAAALALACAACTGKKPPGAECSTASECESEHCVATRRCGSKCTCEHDSDCSPGELCSTTDDCGDSCTSSLGVDHPP
ncbi:MAG TPA: hypothetical protein VMJ10_07735 [Kofleriaceae bacterium]|nr:hypothetical protein [Kofleriaceae bacterium]